MDLLDVYTAVITASEVNSVRYCPRWMHFGKMVVNTYLDMGIISSI